MSHDSCTPVKVYKGLKGRPSRRCTLVNITNIPRSELEDGSKVSPNSVISIKSTSKALSRDNHLLKKSLGEKEKLLELKDEEIKQLQNVIRRSSDVNNEVTETNKKIRKDLNQARGQLIYLQHYSSVKIAAGNALQKELQDEVSKLVEENKELKETLMLIRISGSANDFTSNKCFSDNLEMGKPPDHGCESGAGFETGDKLGTLQDELTVTNESSSSGRSIPQASRKQTIHVNTKEQIPPASSTRTSVRPSSLPVLEEETDEGESDFLHIFEPHSTAVRGRRVKSGRTNVGHKKLYESDKADNSETGQDEREEFDQMVKRRSSRSQLRRRSSIIPNSSLNSKIPMWFSETGRNVISIEKLVETADQECKEEANFCQKVEQNQGKVTESETESGQSDGINQNKRQSEKKTSDQEVTQKESEETQIPLPMSPVHKEGRQRRRATIGVISYKEPHLNTKLRRPW